MSSTTVIPPPKRIKRSHSDPGKEQTDICITATRTRAGGKRITTINPIIIDRKKKKQEKEKEILSLLDAAHARRVAAMEAAPVAASSSSASLTTVNTSTVVWQ